MVGDYLIGRAAIYRTVVNLDEVDTTKCSGELVLNAALSMQKFRFDLVGRHGMAAT